jgi:hypothetical protein
MMVVAVVTMAVIEMVVMPKVNIMMVVVIVAEVDAQPTAVEVKVLRHGGPNRPKRRHAYHCHQLGSPAHCHGSRFWKINVAAELGITPADARHHKQIYLFS